VPAIGTNDNAGPLGYRGASLRVSFDADDSAAFAEQLVDDEAFSQFGTGVDGGVDLQLVENRPPWTERAWRIGCARRALNDDGAKVVRVFCGSAGSRSLSAVRVVPISGV
jgi:hypothetical protein